MDEFQYQIDLLKALNQKLNSECSIYRALVGISGDAFLYYSFEEDSWMTMGNWNAFFDMEVKSGNDAARLFSRIRTEEGEELREAAFVEESGGSFAAGEFCKKNGKQWIAYSVNVIRDAGGQPKEKLLYFRDITKFRKQNDDLAYLAYYDSLTGLYNRNRFIQELTCWIREASEAKTTISVSFININDFRKVNDGIGVSVGDELLLQFGQYLKELCTDEKMMCAHLDADVYCLAVFDPFGERTMENIYRLILERLKIPFILKDSQVSITVSVGVAEYPEAGQTALELIERAQIVMFRVKQYGQSGIRYFDAPVIQDFEESARIENKLRSAVFEGEFLLYFQPQYDTASENLRGVEALLRWRDEEGHMVSPGQFIPIAEKSSLIISISEWVMEEAISTLADWKRKFGVSLTMSVNISDVHFMQDDFVHRLTQLIKQYGVSPKEIELEISEKILVDDFARMLRKLELLRQYGVRAAIDDFGTGCSSFSYLRSVPIQTIKIDRTLVDSIHKDRAGRVILESVVNMVNRLGYDTLAEGVERQEQFDYLKEIGCRYIQGFLYGKPMPGEQIEELLERQVWE